ncbi:MAG: hypothetical protein QNJ58_16005, partial [Desulfobacterales bacterium]|nr:hypothetical protein [Desulfobacterales bacterium]
MNFVGNFRKVKRIPQRANADLGTISTTIDEVAAIVRIQTAAAESRKIVEGKHTVFLLGNNLGRHRSESDGEIMEMNQIGLPHSARTEKV